jgi:hypothetical protein
MAQRPFHPLVLPQGRRPVSARQGVAHQLDMGLLVGRIGFEQLAPVTRLAQQILMQQP